MELWLILREWARYWSKGGIGGCAENIKAMLLGTSLHSEDLF